MNKVKESLLESIASFGIITFHHKILPTPSHVEPDFHLGHLQMNTARNIKILHVKLEYCHEVLCQETGCIMIEYWIFICHWLKYSNYVMTDKVYRSVLSKFLKVKSLFWFICHFITIHKLFHSKTLNNLADKYYT